MSGKHSEVMKTLRAAKKRGWTVESTKGDHYRLTWKDGTRIIASRTPSCRHALKNLMADMKRVERNAP